MSAHRSRSQSGMSLIELMVSITAGLLVVAVATNVLISTLNSNSSTLRYARFNQDLRGVLNAITHDLERAGSWGMAGNVSNVANQYVLVFSADSGSVTVTPYRSSEYAASPSTAEPVTTAFASFLDEDDEGDALVGRTLTARLAVSTGGSARCNLTISAVDAAAITATVAGNTGCTTLPSLVANSGGWTIINPFGLIEIEDTEDGDILDANGANCVRYSYDLNLDGVRDTGANHPNAAAKHPGEYFGFRYDEDQKTIEAGTTPALTCAASGWENVTDPGMISIDSFTIVPVEFDTTTNDFEMGIREYLVTISGSLNSEAGVVRTVSAAVKVRNNSAE